MDNLLPQEDRQRIHKEYRFRSVAVFLALCVVVECFGVVFLLPAYLYSQSRESTIMARKASLPQVAGSDQTILNTLKSLQSKILFLRPDPHVDFSQTVKLLLEHLDGTVTIQSIAIEASDQFTHTISIRGKAKKRQDLLTFKSNLEQAKGVQSVTIPISDYAQETDLNFSASISVHYDTP
jgi:Tfp pilus assembly protein PilN